MSTTHLALILRVLIALCTRTVFQPDEYFQSLEPAHHAVFGYGHLTWEWLAPAPIRSIFYPALNIPIYWALKVSGIADNERFGDILLIYGPKVLHGVLAAMTDIWLCEVTRRWLGSQYVSTVFFVSLTSFFHALSLSRSLSNSLETSLTTIAFAYYPWDASPSLSAQLIYNKSRIRILLIFSVLACMVRPTNAVIWLYLFGKLFWSVKSSHQTAKALFLQTSFIGFVSILTLLALDSLYYGKLTFTPLNFLRTNLSSVSLFYGSNSWHYYITQALPILCTTALPFVIHGMWCSVSDRHAIALRNMLTTIIWSVSVYSLAGHKEWRFIHPILPLLHIFAAKSLVDLTVPGPKKKNKKFRSDEPNSFFHQLLRNLPPIRRSFLALLSLTIPASVYVVFFYCSAPISVLSYIRALPIEELRTGGIGFLTPCHSTPGHAYIHRSYLAEGKMWSLGCEPPLQCVENFQFLHSFLIYSLRNQNLTTYRDQTNVFFDSPVGYLSSRFPARVNPAFPLSPLPASIPGNLSLVEDGVYPWAHEWPRYLVFFGALLESDGVRNLLEAKGYSEVWCRGRRWEGEGERKGGVRVWKWRE